MVLNVHVHEERDNIPQHQRKIIKFFIQDCLVSLVSEENAFSYHYLPQNIIVKEINLQT